MRKRAAVLWAITAIFQAAIVTGCHEVMVTGADTSTSSAPTISQFTLPPTSNTLSVAGIVLKASDPVGVTGYYLSENKAPPSPRDSGWSTLVPTAYVFLTVGTKTLYAWVEDAAGNVSASAHASVVIAVPPGAPTIGAATAGNAQATVSFTAPASNGGSAITGYTVVSTPGHLTATGASSPITVSGLTNGTAYTFTVTAANAIGSGAASAASNSVTAGAVSGRIIPPNDLIYMGAFQLPQGTQGLSSFGYGGYALTWNPNGNGGAGSLFVAANQQHQWVGEVSIPALKTVTLATASTLNTATLLQPVTDITGGALAAYYTSISTSATNPALSMTYIPARGSMTSPRLFWSMGSNYSGASITGWSSTTGWTGGVAVDSTWFLAGSSTPGLCSKFQSPFVSGNVMCGAQYEQYSFLAPQAWADAYTGGASLLVGSSSPNAGGNVYPSVYAIAPWTSDHPANGTVLSNTLLANAPQQTTAVFQDHYAHSTVGWAGAFLSLGSKQAIVFAGKRSLREENATDEDTGANTYPNVRWPFETYKGRSSGTGAHAGNGFDYCPECDQYGVNSGGYQGFPSFGELQFFDPADYVSGNVKPVPYARFNLHGYFLNPPTVQGIQQGAGGIAYDPAGQNIYVAEVAAIAAGAYPVIHVFHLSDSGVSSLNTDVPAPPTGVTDTAGIVSWNPVTDANGGMTYVILKNYGVNGNDYVTGAQQTGDFWKPVAMTHSTSWVDPYYNSGIELTNGYQVVAIDSLMRYSLDYTESSSVHACFK